MSANERLPLLIGALLAALGVLFGAFGTHGLRAVLSPEALGWWQTGVQYQMWQALGLVASKGEARRLIQQGGARVNGVAVTEDGPVAVAGEVRISAGKKKHGLLVAT
jgi:uncharacterized membrane protein YgdD (TMEM256/DUF423 family)